LFFVGFSEVAKKVFFCMFFYDRVERLGEFYFLYSNGGVRCCDADGRVVFRVRNIGDFGSISAYVIWNWDHYIMEVDERDLYWKNKGEGDYLRDTGMVPTYSKTHYLKMLPEGLLWITCVGQITQTCLFVPHGEDV
jgi:hypothetical protein